jgi:REP element-mobilizing transposase RayT
MSRKYKFNSLNGVYFVSFATVNWIDVFTRQIYKDIIVDSLNYCIENKGLIVYAWVIMTNHIHLIVATDKEPLENILRDLKKFTSKAIIKEIEENQKESRKGWMLWMFQRAGQKNSNNTNYQFWQQHNQPIDITQNNIVIDNVFDYIHNNPVKAGFVQNPQDYVYSSAAENMLIKTIQC